MHDMVQQGHGLPNDIACSIAGSGTEIPTCDFVRAADEFCAVGVPVVPVWFDDKKPKVRNAQKFGITGSLKVAEKHPVANVGFWAGRPSKIAVIDIDSSDIEHLDWARETFGPTDMLVRTPSGNFHLYYRYSGEPHRIRLVPDRRIDLLTNSLCLAPPSVRPGIGQYQFIDCDHGDLRRLPAIRHGAVNEALAKLTSTTLPSAGLTAQGITPSWEQVHEGDRNNQLFYWALNHADGVDSVEALIALLEQENSRRFVPPSPTNEILRIAKSIWTYKQNNRLYSVVGQHIALKASTIAPLIKSGDSDALMLHAVLMRSHFERGKTFAVSANAMSKHRVIGNWSPPRYRKARDRLLELNILTELHRGGSRPGDPSRYQFADGPVQ